VGALDRPGFRARRRRGWTLTIFTLGALALWPGTASAKCHVATFTENAWTVSESKPGYAELTVELDGSGPVTCTGTIKWKTQAVTAKAGSDYKESSGELRWSPTGMQPRAQSFRVPIIDNTTAEAAETFKVIMTAAPGSEIQPEEAAGEAEGPSAVVRITDDDRAGASPTSSPKGTATTSRGGGGSSPAPTFSGSTQPTSASTTGAVPTPSTTVASARAVRTGSGSGGSGALGLVAALVTAGAGAGWLLWRRSTANR
jgi:Calx-beta domain-containing protein